MRGCAVKAVTSSCRDSFMAAINTSGEKGFAQEHNTSPFHALPPIPLNLKSNTSPPGPWLSESLNTSSLQPPPSPSPSPFSPLPSPLPLPLLLPLPLPPTPCLVYVHIHQCLHLFIKLADSSKAVVVVVPSSTMWGSLNTVSFPMQ